MVDKPRKSDGMPEKTSASKVLREGIKSKFADHLHSLGFERERMKDSSGRHYFFRRALPNHHDLVDVQFELYHRPKFVINFGSTPPDGIVNSYGRTVSANKVRCFELVENGRLARNPFQWFGVSSIKAAIFGIEAAADSEIRLAIRKFQQVEDWFNKRIVGYNISISKDPHREPSAAKRAMMEKVLWPPEGWDEYDNK